MSIIEKLNQKKSNNLIINRITSNITGVIGKPCWTEFNWKSGRVLGILRTLSWNRHIPKVFEAAEIEPEVIDVYIEVGGNLPYIDKQGNFQTGRHQSPEELVELLQYVYDKLGLVITKDEFSDINTQHWEELHNAAMERIRKTLEVTDTIQYDE